MLLFPYPLRFLFATRPAVFSQVPGIVNRAISTFLDGAYTFYDTSTAKHLRSHPQRT